jgi:hypothetical protein
MAQFLVIWLKSIFPYLDKASRAFRGNPYNVMRSVNVKLPVFDADLTPCAKDNIPLFRNKRQLQKVRIS